MTFVNKNWLLYQLSDQKIKKMPTSLKIRGIKTLKYKFAQFAEVFLFLSGESNKG